MRRWVRCLVPALLVSLRLGAQELPFRHFTPNDQVNPLSSASVQKVTQDHLGYIWFAFYSSGLTRYDGHAMEEYGIEDGLRDLTLREVAEDGTHHLWAGSESGLVVSEKPLDAYEPGKRVKFVSAVGNERLPQMRVRRNCLVTGIDGWVWAGVQDVLVRYRFHGDALERGTIDTRADDRRHLQHADAARRLRARGAELRSDSAIRSRRERFAGRCTVRRRASTAR